MAVAALNGRFVWHKMAQDSVLVSKHYNQASQTAVSRVYSKRSSSHSRQRALPSVTVCSVTTQKERGSNAGLPSALS